MAAFDIKLSELLFNPTRSPVGQIWIEANGLAFPHVGWSDFALVVMSWFGSALLNVAKGSEIEAFDFMEGPYSLEIKSVSNGSLEISGKCGANRDHEAFRQRLDSDRLVRLFISRAEYLLGLCEENSWWSSDANSLKSTAHALRRSLTRSV